jgi:hypothetical protein
MRKLRDHPLDLGVVGNRAIDHVVENPYYLFIEHKIAQAALWLLEHLVFDYTHTRRPLGFQTNPLVFKPKTL